jgi:hypothetical protein
MRFGPANPGNPRCYIEGEPPPTSKDIRSKRSLHMGAWLDRQSFASDLAFKVFSVKEALAAIDLHIAVEFPLVPTG